MRISYFAIAILLLLSFIFVLPPPAVSSQEMPLLVIEQKWGSERRTPRAEKDPFEDIREDEENEKQRIQNIRTNEIRRAQGLPTINPPVPPMKNDTGSNEPTISYFYQMKVKNIGKLEIREIQWEYLFFELSTNRAIGKRYFESEVRIAPGKIKTVEYRTGISPTATINAATTGDNSKEKYRERIEIRRIEFADGSFWTAKN